MNMTRKVDLKKWVSVDKRLPKKGQKVMICDADPAGFADYELPTTFDGSEFIMEGFGKVRGMTYWQPK